ncbi:MAG: 50S ribosomal protein L9 [Demequinaceae bacterium]|nr:50S ribosomal protein L9 [Demequinaceae bacterium]
MAKVILTHEVSGLGVAGDVVEVKDGYARNFLMPRKLATLWSGGAEKQIEAMRKARRVKTLESVEEAHAARDALQSAPVIVLARAGESGRLFGAVTTSDIVKAIGDRAIVDKRRIHLPHHIKALGDHQVEIGLHDGVSATVTVTVISED